MTRFGWASMGGGAILVLAGLALPLGAQDAAVAVAEENFRAEPGGSILAELLEGTLVSPGEERGQWREVTLEAWIWGRSVRPQQAELDLIVNASGENLRASPNGARIGRAMGGTRLQRLETREDWIRVRRTGWIWSASLEVTATGASEVPAPPSTGAPPTPTAQEREFAAIGEAAILHDRPDGETLGRLPAGSTVEVLARDGAWSQVRIEGWTLSSALTGADSDSGPVLRGVSRDSLEANPESYRGRLVEWTVQFIAIQEAERFRTDLRLGEPFMLTRGPDDDLGFVYVAVPPEHRAAVDRLSPLQRIRILGRIRTVRSSLTGAPVLDLLEISGR